LDFPGHTENSIHVLRW